MTDEKKVETKRSLIDGIDGKPYPNVPADVKSSEQKRTIRCVSLGINENGADVWNTTGIGQRNDGKVYKDLALHSNILMTGGGQGFWWWMPHTCSDNLNPADRKKFRREVYEWDQNGVHTLLKFLHGAKSPGPNYSIVEESIKASVLITNMAAPLKILAKYAEKNTFGMTMYQRSAAMTIEEKAALVQCLGYMGKPNFATPEMYTRFVNPLGSMGDIPAYDGMTAYFHDLGLRVQHHSMNWQRQLFGDVTYQHTNEPYELDRKLKKKGVLGDVYMVKADPMEIVQDFYVQQKDMNLSEAARLLGLAAKQWGIDKVNTKDPDECQQLRNRIARFYKYLFVSKAVQLIKERVHSGKEHPMLVIPKDDAQAIIEYSNGKISSKLNIIFRDKKEVYLDAERALVREIDAMRLPGAAEYQMLQDLLAGKDGEPMLYSEDFRNARWHNNTCPPIIPNMGRFRVTQYDMLREKFHAMNYLLANNEEGKKLVFGR